jgi:hypothetical protein
VLIPNNLMQARAQRGGCSETATPGAKISLPSPGVSRNPTAIGRFIPLNPRDGAKMAFPDRIDGGSGNKKKRQRSRRIEAIPHSYLASIEAKELRVVKGSLPQQGLNAGGNLRILEKLSTTAHKLPAQVCYPCARENGTPPISKAGSLRAL